METLFDFLVKIDKNAFLFINAKSGTYPLVDSAAKIIASDYLIPVSFSLILVLIWCRGGSLKLQIEGRSAVLKSISTLLCACFVVFILNEIAFRDRPYTLPDARLIFYAPTDSSFPSNSVAAVAGMAIPIFRTYRVLGIIMLIGSFSLGVGRIFVGIHFPGDVIGGSLIAIVSFWIIGRLFYIFDKQIIYLILLFEKSKWLKIFRI
ncbi:phosphatase PAP2 family protein [Chloroflexi bacterium]|nr:phosphatase PAP2 family protein [Chloroflexota bacterium]